MNSWKQLDQPPKDDRTVSGVRQWWKSFIDRANETIKEKRSLDGVDPEIVRQAIEPNTLDTVRRAAAVLQQIVDQVRDAFDEAPEDEAVERDPGDETPGDAERSPLDATPTDETQHAN